MTLRTTRARDRGSRACCWKNGGDRCAPAIATRRLSAGMGMGRHRLANGLGVALAHFPCARGGPKCPLATSLSPEVARGCRVSLAKCPRGPRRVNLGQEGAIRRRAGYGWELAMKKAVVGLTGLSRSFHSSAISGATLGPFMGGEPPLARTADIHKARGSLLVGAKRSPAWASRL